MKRSIQLAGVIAGVCLLTVGCSSRSGNAPAVQGELARQFLLNEEPTQTSDVIALRERLQDKGAEEEVALVGLVGGAGDAIWDPEQAAFMITDVSLAGEQGGEHSVDASGENAEPPKHDADNCPFCRAKRKKLISGSALVEMVDSAGNVPPVDARQLLGLSEGQTVVVLGKAQLDGLGGLKVRAHRLYVRPTRDSADGAN